MKRLIIFFLTVSVFFVFFSCAGSKLESYRGEETDCIELTGNPTTGYTWLYQIEDESVIKLDEVITYLGEERIVGAPSLFSYKVTGLKTGKTKVNFIYLRPWEQQEPARTKVFEVTVTESGEIFIKNL